ncbi:MAG: HAMP domain-containing sensor histidine kinase [Oscillospiraceae bacterium]|nr:HAMP domain-containing sensor histidine kinase [Oscillospiraceae bacterium]
MSKKKRQTSGLFKEYFTIFFLVILVSFTVLGGSLIVFARNYFRDEKIKLLSENAENISQSVAQMVGSNYATQYPTNTALMICGDLTTVSGAIDADFFICNTEGKVIYCQEMRRGDMVLYTGDCIIHNKIRIPQDILQTLGSKSYSGTTTLKGSLSSKNFVYATAVKIDDAPVAYVVGMQPVMESLKPYILAILRMFGISALITLAVAFVAVYFMSYELTRPLRQMSEATKRYAEGDFSMRIQVDGRNEMADLAKAFNSMAKDLASLESSRRSFVANVSHELKTPMTTIGGFIDGILDGTIEKDQQEHYLRIVSDEVKRLHRLVVSMLNLSKIEAGELALKRRDFDVSEMIFRTILGFEQLIEQKGFEITGLENMQSVIISGDEDLLTQVVYNLIDNAVKFTPEGGEIHFDVVHDMQKVYVSIRNSGKGVSSEEIERIFERFYKVDKSRSYDVKGAGLGLYITKSIVEMHGGSIKASSLENQYTEFSFWLPIHAENM